jgi:hypothetical protein
LGIQKSIQNKTSFVQQKIWENILFSCLSSIHGGFRTLFIFFITHCDEPGSQEDKMNPKWKYELIMQKQKLRSFIFPFQIFVHKPNSILLCKTVYSHHYEMIDYGTSLSLPLDSIYPLTCAFCIYRSMKFIGLKLNISGRM